MQQHAVTCPSTSDTGPGREAITRATHLGCDLATDQDASATATVVITHNAVEVTAILNMGSRQAVTQRWERRRGLSTGWKLVSGPRLFNKERERLSPALAEFMENLEFPFDLANMLPRRPTAAAREAIAAAAQEVARA